MMNLSKLLVPITLDSKPFLKFSGPCVLYYTLPTLPPKVHSARAPKCCVVFFVTFFRYGGADSYPFTKISSLKSPYFLVKKTKKTQHLKKLYIFYTCFMIFSSQPLPRRRKHLHSSAFSPLSHCQDHIPSLLGQRRLRFHRVTSHLQGCTWVHWIDI